MNRGVITISESGTVSMPTDTVWMTMQEIADMYNVFGCYVRKAVKAIFKDGILKEQGVRRHVRKNDRISYDVYSLGLVIAVAFRIDSIESTARSSTPSWTTTSTCYQCIQLRIKFNFALYCFDARDCFLYFANAHWIIQLTCCELKTEVKQLLFKSGNLLIHFGSAQVANVINLHLFHAPILGL